ncbi:uncharacterized protein LOC127735047 [Mytilus californianus]|uniref:uncharacterized protein LOC127735047 n=1 Tax=Mytilus californianus TaxID=6549 RepID=UPI002246FEDA|nr:uncharacterized protein LOC127735047 [Mytilus californianus]
MADHNERTINRTVFTLKDFTECYTPPKTFKVLGGRGLYSNAHTTALRVGDSLYLHTLAVEWICLSFFDTDTGIRREVKVPPDSQIKFNIVHRSQEAFQRIYTTVSELLEAWPTRFQANYGREDPYLPQIFRKGERFRFIRRAQNPNDRKLCLECEDESGHILTLPSNCRGDFTVLDDPKSYNLQEIVAFGDTERTLKFSEENIQLIAVDNDESSFYTNVGNNGEILTKLTGLPLTYKGLITMRKPNFFVIVSPQDNHDIKWKISLEEEVEVMDQLDDFLPSTRDMSLNDFIDNFELDLPVIARISNYGNKISHFQDHLSPGTEVIVHRIDKDVDRVLASTKCDIFSLGSDVKGKFDKCSRRFKSVQTVLDTREKIKLKVTEAIACDVPEPFCLKCGDILKCTNFNIQNVKIRYGKKVYGECQVVQWDILDDTGARAIIKLPADLEVTLQEIAEDDGFEVSNILQYRVEVPMDAFSLESDSFLPYNQSIRFEHYVSDPLVLISPIPRNSDTKHSCLDAKIDLCLMVPLRHDLTLHLRERLHFPPSYFILPRRAKWLSTGPEKISLETYNNLMKFNDQAYEDYECKDENVDTASGNTNFVNRMRDGVRRLSRLSLKMTRSTSQINEPEVEKTPDLRRNYSFQSETNIPGVSNHLYDSDPRYNDDNIYEDYTGAIRRTEKNKQSVGRKLLRRLSKRGKR